MTVLVFDFTAQFAARQGKGFRAVKGSPLRGEMLKLRALYELPATLHSLVQSGSAGEAVAREHQSSPGDGVETLLGRKGGESSSGGE